MSAHGMVYVYAEARGIRYQHQGFRSFFAAEQQARLIRSMYDKDAYVFTTDRQSYWPERGGSKEVHSC